MAEGPKVRRYSQPLGKPGVAHSLDMVASKSIEGGKDEVVRAWDTHVLKACGFPKGARARAECLLADTRLYPWMPDPTDVEFIPSARLMMPNLLTGEEAIYLAEDCDGLTTRWLSMCLAAGIRCQVVGYSFDEDKQITHVLGSIWDDVAEEWLDGDPSFQDMPLGHKNPHTWEQRRDLPTMEISCDGVFCNLKKPPTDEGVVDFVGVGTPVDGRAPVVGMPSLEELGQELTGLAASLDANLLRMKTLYDAMRATFAADNVGIVDVAELAPYGWSAEDQQRAIDIAVIAHVASKYLLDAAAGVRAIWPAQADEPVMKGLAPMMKQQCLATGGVWSDKDVDCACPAGFAFDFYKGCADPRGQVHETTWAIEKKPGDVFGVELDANGNPVLVDAQGMVGHSASGTVGNPLVAAAVLAAGAVIYVAVATAIVKGLQAAAEIIKTVSETYLESRVTQCYQPGSGVSSAECDARVAARRDFRLKSAAADAELAKAKAAEPNALDTGLKAVNTALEVGSAVLVTYGLYRLYLLATEKKKRSS